jgi:hypothetical protein
LRTIRSAGSVSSSLRQVPLENVHVQSFVSSRP